MNEHLLMLGRFVRSPRTVGAVGPSSRALASEMVSGLSLGGTTNVVELGPGTGAFTREIVRKLGPRARCIAIELEPTFATALERDFPRVDVVCGSATDLPSIAAEKGMATVDHIVSGLPFASLPSADTQGILEAVAEALKPGGTFTTFQYVTGYPTPLASALRRDMTARLGVRPTRRLVFRNFPPAFVLTWHRPFN